MPASVPGSLIKAKEYQAIKTLLRDTVLNFAKRHGAQFWQVLLSVSAKMDVIFFFIL